MTSPRSILIACDKFKGSLTADEACSALARGLGIRFPEAVIVTHPIADGGEGFAASLEIPLAGKWVELVVNDALGRKIRARYLLAGSPDGSLAIMEMSEASGLRHIQPAERDILHSSTYGTGEMMRHAVLTNHVTRMIIGIGGSATNDGGAGMAAALGVRFLDAGGNELAPTPAALHTRLHRIDTGARIPLPQVTVACDVASPLLGPDGATRVFSPQKGASETDMLLLESALSSLVRCSGGETQALQPGAGAAGGLGFGLLRFANAELVSGFELLAGLTGLQEKITAADLIVTGEGSLDAQSLAGKGPVGVAELARRHGRPVIAFCGSVSEEVRKSGLFQAITTLDAGGLPMETLMSDAARLLESAAMKFGNG